MKRLLFFASILQVVFLLPRPAIAQTTATSQTVENGAMTTPIVWSTGGGCIYNWFNATTGIGLPTSGSGDIAPFKAINNGSTPIMVTITAAPLPRPILAYIPSQATNRVTVVNTTDFTIVAQIPVGKKPYGVAVSKDGTRVYVSNYDGRSVSVIDAVNNKWITDIGVGDNPTGVAVSPDGSRVYVGCFGSSDVYVINTPDYTLASIIPNMHAVSGIVVSPDGNNVYISNSIGIYAYIPLTNKTKYIATASQPQGVVVSANNNLVYSADAYHADVYAGIMYLSDYLYSYDQVYTLIDVANNNDVQHINSGAFDAFGAALSPDGSRLYISAPKVNILSVIKTQSNTLDRLVNVGSNPNGVSVAPNGLVYVINQDSPDKSVSVIDPSTNTVSNTFKTGDAQSFALGNFITGNTCDSSTPITYTLTINPSPPTIIAEGTPDVLTTPSNIPSAPTKIDVSGINLTEGIAVKAPAGFEISLDDLTYGPTLVIGNGGSPPPVQLFIRLAAGNAVGPYGGNIVLTSQGAANVSVAISGTVTNAVPYVITSAAAGTITACQGYASVSPKVQQFTVSGTLLTGNITLTAPTNANFEIALTATGIYGNNLTIPNTTGTIPNTTVYVRSAASASGIIAGNVSVQSNGATQRLVAVNGVVADPPTVNTVPDQARTAGQNTAAIKFTGTGNTYNWVNNNPSIGLAAGGSGNIAAFKTINASTTVTETANITVTPLNAPLAYVANWDLNSVSVININNGQVVNDIKVDSAPYATAVSPDGTTVYVANQGSNTISIINTASNTVVGRITAGPKPSGLAISPDGKILYVTMGDAKNILAFDTGNPTVWSELPVGVSPLGIAVSPNGSWVYVANRNSNTLSVISTQLHQKLYDIQVGTSPESVAVSPDGSAVYVTNYNSGSVSVITTADNKLAYTIQVGSNPRGIAISQDGSMLYVTNYGSRSVSVIRTSDRSIVATVKAGTNPEGISISPDGKLIYVANFNSHNITVINTVDNSVNTTIDLLGAPVSFGNFIIAGTGCVGNSTTFKITVAPALQRITASGALSALTTVYGSASKAITFTVSGVNMTQGILVSPPDGFEVSADGGVTYDKTTLVGISGTIPPSLVYTRLAATTPVGSNYSGDIQLTSDGAPTATMATVKSTVTKALLTIMADDQQRNYGKDNPILTVKYNGFVNNEDETQLIKLPVISTTAIATSVPGTYPITVSGAEADNYAFTYVQGTLTVLNANGIKPAIPNTFTPNGDGVNDTWLIKNLDTYPNCTVEIFSRSGQQVFYANNYLAPWDGRYKGINLPVGVYYYIINLNNNENPLSGYVAIIR